MTVSWRFVSYSTTNQDLLDQFACTLVETFGPFHLSVQNFLERQVIGRATERRSTSDKLEENATKSPNVGPVHSLARYPRLAFHSRSVCRIVSQDLRTDILCGPNKRALLAFSCEE
jgi:hypothetical protein